MAARIPMMTVTMSSSIKVNPRVRTFMVVSLVLVQKSLERGGREREERQRGK
jgi:hypothetical protein